MVEVLVFGKTYSVEEAALPSGALTYFRQVKRRYGTNIDADAPVPVRHKLNYLLSRYKVPSVTFNTVTLQSMEDAGPTGITYWSTLYANMITTGQTDPDGGPTAFKLSESSEDDWHYVMAEPTNVELGTGRYKVELKVKPAGRDNIRIIIYSGTIDIDSYFNLTGTGEVVFAETTFLRSGTSAKINAATIEALENDWYKCTVDLNWQNGFGYDSFELMLLLADGSPTTAGENESYQGDGESGVILVPPDILFNSELLL